MQSTQKIIIHRLTHLPDLVTQTYTARHGNDVRSRVFERQEGFLHLLHELGMHGNEGLPNGSTASLRFLYEPRSDGSGTMQIYLLFQNQTGMEKSKLQATLLNSPLAEFYPAWQEVKDNDEVKRVLTPENYNCCVEIIKEEAAPVALFKTMERQALEQAEIRAKTGAPGPGPEDVRNRFRSVADTAFYYIPLYVAHPFEPVPEQDMLLLDRYFAAYDQPFMVEITLEAAALQAEELLAIEKMINHLERVKGFSTAREGEERSFLRREQQDFTAEAIAETFEEYHEKLLQERYFQFAIRIWGKDPDLTPILAANVARECNGSGKYRKIILKSGEELYKQAVDASSRIAIAPEVCWQEYWDESWDKPFQETDVFPFNNTGKRGGAEKKRAFSFIYDLRRLPRLARLESLASFFRLPVPGPEPLQTMRKETEAPRENSEAADRITLGTDFYKPGLSHSLDLELIKKHIFISGVPGSGKTTSIFNILIQLHEQGIPFIVFEPAKTEYRLLKRLKKLGKKGAVSPDGKLLGEELQVYTLGQEHISPLRFNPFQFPEGITLNEHVSSLEACFRGAMPISTGPLPALINEAVDQLYGKSGWRGTSVNQGKLEYPDLAGLYKEIREVFTEKNYSGDVRGDLQTAIEVRIGSLLRRSVGRIFDSSDSLPDITTLMQTPCIIELDGLNEEQSNLMIMFLLAQIREYVRANRRSGADLSHVIVLEEAHNIIGKAEEGTEEGGNPKAEATKYITNFLAEVRALGEGIIIADQLPSAVAPEVIKNTGVKLAHRMVSGDDREELGLTMLLDGHQFEDMARLPPGEAFLFHEQMYKPIRIKGEYVAAEDAYPILKQAPPDGRELVEILAKEPWFMAVRDAIQQTTLDFMVTTAEEISIQMETEQERTRRLCGGLVTLLQQKQASPLELDKGLKGLSSQLDALEQLFESRFNFWQQSLARVGADEATEKLFWKKNTGKRLTVLSTTQQMVVADGEKLLAGLQEIAKMLLAGK